MQGFNASACFSVTVTHKISCQVYLLLQVRDAIGNSPADCLHLESNPGETLSQGVMDLVCHAFAFFEGRLKFPAFDSVEDAQGEEGNHQHCEARVTLAM